MKKPAFDSITLSSVIFELQALIGAKVQRISQISEHEIIIPLYVGKEQFLLISTDPQAARAHLVKQFPSGIKPPPPFLLALRKSIQNSKLIFARQRGLDRILELGFSGEEGDFQLVAELMGKHSNAMLVDKGTKVIGAMKWVSPSQSRRPILPGKPYLPPPFEPKPSLWLAKAGDKLTDFEGFSPFLAQLLEAGILLPSILDIWQHNDWAPVSCPNFGAYPIDISKLGITTVRINSISEGLETHYSALTQSNAHEAERRKLHQQLSRVLLARETALAGVEEALQTAALAPELQKWGELILTYQGSVRSGASMLAAYGFDGEEVQIPLDGSLTPVENANRYFHRARHAKGRASEVAQQRDRLARDVSELALVLSQLQESTDLAQIQPLTELAARRLWLQKAALPKAKEDRPYEGFSVRELISPAGYKILYGQNATSNDYLTTKVAKPNDWWFHVRGQTSAHVILQTANHPEKVQRPDLEYAAQVAVRHSVAKHSGYVDVDYTLKKYVRKAKKSAAGAASYVNEKTITVMESSVE